MNIAFNYMHLRITESCVQKTTNGLACAQRDLFGRKCKKLFIACQLKIERMKGWTTYLRKRDDGQERD
jgi:hypothetical protein